MSITTTWLRSITFLLQLPVGLLLCGLLALATPPRYNLTFLPLPVPDTAGVQFHVWGINNSGEAVGVVYQSGAYQAYIWTAANLPPTPLAALPAGVSLYGTWMMINDREQVAATVSTPLGYRPVLWTTSQVTILPYSANDNCIANGINNVGEITMQCGGYPYMYVWQTSDGSIWSVNSRPTQDCTAPNPSPVAYGINDAHQIAGYMSCSIAEPDIKAAILSTSSPAILLGKPPAPTGYVWFTEGWQINASGDHVIGRASLYQLNQINPPVNVTAMLWTNGSATILDGVPGCSDSRHWAAGISKSDMVLIAGGCAGLWQSGQTYDLRTLVNDLPPSISNFNVLSGGQFASARLMNDSGQIAFSVLTAAGYRGILLTPVTADSTPPSTVATPSSAPNASGWYRTNVALLLVATDNSGGSGVKQLEYTLSGAQNSGPLVVSGSSASVPISAEGTTTLTYFATDNAGNSEQPTNLTVQIDKTAPTVVMNGPTNGGVYQLGVVPAASCSVSDNLSGVASGPTLAVSGGTSNGVGSFTATCSSATDYAGNASAPVSISYSVRYRFVGFSAPIKANSMNPATAGRVVGLKWQLLRSDGSPVRALSTASSVSSIPIACTTGAAIGAAVPADSAGGSGLKYDPIANQYVFNWQTAPSWAGTCRRFLLNLDDSTAHTADFTLK